MKSPAFFSFEVEFEYDWGKENGGKVTYGQDLHEFLFDYSEVPTDNRAVSYTHLDVYKRQAFKAAGGKAALQKEIRNEVRKEIRRII